jgi:molybdate transport system permease protein
VDRLFKAAAFASLFLILAFLLAVISSLLWHIKGDVALPYDEITFAAKLSLTTATLATVLSIIFGVPVAYILSRTNFPGKSIVDTLLDLPIVLSPVALGTALLAFFSTPLGRLFDFGIVFEVPGIILAQFTIIVALMIRLMKAGFDSINKRYEDVARTLGCTSFEAFYRVTLPLSKHTLTAAVIIAWARALGEFGATVTLAGATRFKTETLPIAIFLNLESANITSALIIVYVLILAALLVLVVTRRLQHDKS